MESNIYLPSGEIYQPVSWHELDVAPTSDGKWQTVLNLGSPVILDRLHVDSSTESSVSDLNLTVNGNVLSILRATFGATSNLIIGSAESFSNISTARTRGPVFARESLKLEYINSWVGANVRVKLQYTLMEKVR